MPTREKAKTFHGLAIEVIPFGAAMETPVLGRRVSLEAGLPV